MKKEVLDSATARHAAEEGTRALQANVSVCEAQISNPILASDNSLQVSDRAKLQLVHVEAQRTTVDLA